MLQPLNASQMRSPSPMTMPRSPIGSDALKQNVQIDRRAFADGLAARGQELISGPAAFVAQHTDEVPFGVQFGGIAERAHDVVGHEMDTHFGPLGAFAVAGLCDLP